MRSSRLVSWPRTSSLTALFGTAQQPSSSGLHGFAHCICHEKSPWGSLFLFSGHRRCCVASARFELALRRPNLPEGNMLQSQGIAAIRNLGLRLRVFSFDPGVRNRTQCALRKKECTSVPWISLRANVRRRPTIRARSGPGRGACRWLSKPASPRPVWWRFLMPADDRDAARFAEWVGAGRAGTMHYLERVDESGRLVRSRVGIPFPWARSAIVCFANYHCAQPRSTEPAAGGRGLDCAAMPGAAAGMRAASAAPAIITKCSSRVLGSLNRACDERTRRFRSARICRHWPRRRARPGHGRRPRMDGQEHLPYPSKTGLLWLSGCSSYFARCAGRTAAAHSSRPLRNLPPLPRRVPHRRARLRPTRWTRHAASPI